MLLECKHTGAQIKLIQLIHFQHPWLQGAGNVSLGQQGGGFRADKINDNDRNRAH